jgi:hypothetical protein
MKTVGLLAPSRGGSGSHTSAPAVASTPTIGSASSPSIKSSNRVVERIVAYQPRTISLGVPPIGQQAISQVETKSPLANTQLWGSIAFAIVVVGLFIVLANRNIPSLDPSNPTRGLRALSNHNPVPIPPLPPRASELSLFQETDRGSPVLHQEAPVIPVPLTPSPRDHYADASVQAQGPQRTSEPLTLESANSVIPRIGSPTVVATETSPILDLNQIEETRRVQKRLVELGFLFGTTDGNWGLRSRKALQEFRKAKGIGDNDAWDLETQQQLFSTTEIRSNKSATSFKGGWGVSLEQCRLAEHGSSPISINTLGAEAFGAGCKFSSTQQMGPNLWHVRATCTDSGEKWKANIRLTVTGNKLTWVSERGTARYVRCSAL